MIRLYGRRVLLRPLVNSDFAAWAEVRRRNGDFLLRWEPRLGMGVADPSRDRSAFEQRVQNRERERQIGSGYGFGLFVDSAFAGEINLNNVVRGAFQSGYVGYWIDEARAGRSYMPEAVVTLARFAFDELKLHRIEIDIVPRNRSSRRVVEKLGLREEGIAERFLEINGVWEDHVRYGLTFEEWAARRIELVNAWL
jgi:[ribosomal protein S5]-alanine N-acetyltransferase